MKSAAAAAAAETRPLTDAQRRILEWSLAMLLEEHATPTLREIGRRFGISSPNGVMCHLKAMKRKGYISRPEMSSRRIKILRLPDGRPFPGLMLKPTEGR